MTIKQLRSDEKLSNLIGLIYDAAIDPSYWSEFLNGFSILFSSEKALLLSLSKHSKQDLSLHTLNLDLGILAQWENSVEHVDVWFQALLNCPQSAPELYSSLVPVSELKKTGFHADFLVPLDVQHAMGSHVCASTNFDSFLSVFRGPKKNDYTAEDIQRLSLLLPHVRRGLHINQALATAENSLNALSEALNQSACNVLIIGQSSELLFANKSAMKLLLTQDGITVRYGKLSFWDYQSQLDFNDLIQSAIASTELNSRGAGQATFARRPSRKAPLRIEAFPFNNRTPRIAFAESGSCLILVHDPTELHVPDVEFLRQSYGLTNAEARFCVSFFRNGALDSTMADLKITRNTAKSHLRHVFQKMGVSNQVQLVKAIALGIK